MMEQDKMVNDYLREISRMPLLNQEKEVALAKRISKGDKKAKEELINCNLRLAVSFAKRYVKYSHLTLLDLIQEGNRGIMKAAEKFNHKMGYRFSTYAAFWVRQYITRAMSNQSSEIRIPVHVVEKIHKIIRAENYQRRNGNRNNIKKTEKIMGYNYKFFSFQGQLRNDEDDGDGKNNSFERLIDKDGRQVRLLTKLEAKSNSQIYNQLDQKELKEILRNALNLLPPRTRLIIRLRFGFNGQPELTLKKIARIVGVCHERVRQIEEVTLEKLRERYGRELSCFFFKS